MRVGPCVDTAPADAGVAERFWAVADYDLDSTLGCGQAFRWRRRGSSWEGVVAGRWVELRQVPGGVHARVAAPVADWDWLVDYLRLKVPLESVLATFPTEPELQAAIRRWRGLRVLRQPAWECLASFLLSTSKRIAQIQQVIERLCQRWGDPVSVPPDHPPAWSFPGPDRLAGAGENELRRCGMGFRAPYLIAAARAVVEGRLDLDALRRGSYAGARAALMALPGVGPKVADCVCLFGLGFLEAFPVDTWVARALRERYFRGRRVSPERLAEFGRRHFGPYAGYAQQYLFHDRRLRAQRRPAEDIGTPAARSGRPSLPPGIAA
ncbi:DNA-3-methyladenine glycosylase family protein [Limisphaera sp. VF-2]|jgi:N-glycosylase/DNA lyase|uniref:DNA-3-methyladenine glycosylase family protein n=1 Tax=Limisphaera sp. VF-2 TaxID=3400418 RepID=UPI00176C1F1A|nr:hypothetical protein [Limisphaera sp.]